MKFINSSYKGDEFRIAYSDYGTGRPVVLLHGWPLSREMWEYQLNDLVEAGFRVIKYDRRGFGKSSKPWDGYDYDTLADDLNLVMEELNLSNATLVGFSMGGGEVLRYLTRFSSSRVKQIVLLSSVAPFMLKTANNPDGVDASVFDDMMASMKEDRINFLDGFGKKFFGVNLLSHPVSAPLLEYYRMLGSFASARSTQQCAISFSQTDFRPDVKNISVPVLIIHGEDDKTVPIKASSDRLAAMLPDCTYIVYEGAPHGLFYTHREQLNKDLIHFLRGELAIGSTRVSENVSYV